MRRNLNLKLNQPQKKRKRFSMKTVLKALALAILLAGCATSSKPVEPTPPAPTPNPPVVVPQEKVVVINFKFNSYKLGAEQKKAIDDAVKSRLDGSKVTIIGYTDSQGTTAYNKKLSEKRAKAVFKYLEASKVQSSWTAIGEGKLLNKDKTKAEHAANRRAELGFVVKVSN